MRVGKKVSLKVTFSLKFGLSKGRFSEVRPGLTPHLATQEPPPPRDPIREMGRNRKSASLITQSVLIISIENSFVLALIRSLKKFRKKRLVMRRRLVSIWLWHNRELIFFVFDPLLFKLSVSSNKFYTNL